MRITKQLVFDILWRLAVIALPWQTRWFSEASLVGWPWEQGRISIYGSWLAILVAIGVGMLIPAEKRKQSISKWAFVPFGCVFILSLIATGFDSMALTAVLSWWAHVFLLSLFGFVLWRNRIPFSSFASWVVLSLIPHATLGLVQYAVQHVSGSSFFGIATQIPADAGVSVVEHGEYRMLRAYGGFPHPNTFGGWMATGLLASLFLSSRVTKKSLAIFCLATSVLFSFALLLTYSRSAWVAVVVGFVLLIIHLVRTRAVNQFFVVATLASLFFSGVVAFSERDHIFARAEISSRLESQSLDVRAQSLVAGWSIFQEHRWIGTGPSVELYRLAQRISAEKSGMPLEPPHNVYVLLFIEFGIIGTGLFLAMISLFAWHYRSRLTFRLAVFLVPLAVIGFFDHYLWSYWAGHALVFVAISLGILRENEA